MDSLFNLEKGGPWNTRREERKDEDLLWRDRKRPGHGQGAVYSKER